MTLEFILIACIVSLLVLVVLLFRMLHLADKHAERVEQEERAYRTEFARGLKEQYRREVRADQGMVEQLLKQNDGYVRRERLLLNCIDLLNAAAADDSWPLVATNSVAGWCDGAKKILQP